MCSCPVILLLSWWDQFPSILRSPWYWPHVCSLLLQVYTNRPLSVAEKLFVRGGQKKHRRTKKIDRRTDRWLRMQEFEKDENFTAAPCTSSVMTWHSCTVSFAPFFCRTSNQSSCYIALNLDSVTSFPSWTCLPFNCLVYLNLSPCRHTDVSFLVFWQALWPEWPFSEYPRFPSPTCLPIPTYKT